MARITFDVPESALSALRLSPNRVVPSSSTGSHVAASLSSRRQPTNSTTKFVASEVRFHHIRTAHNGAERMEMPNRPCQPRGMPIDAAVDSNALTYLVNAIRPAAHADSIQCSTSRGAQSLS
jgi:hypothetical protein